MQSSKRTKVLFLISSLANEGPTRVLLNIIKYMQKEDFDFEVITLVPEKSNSIHDNFANESCSVSMANDFFPKQASFFQKIRILREYVANKRVDIVHGHCPRSLFILPFLKGPITFYTAHIFPGVQTKALYGNFKGSVVANLCNFLIKFVDRTIACSASVAHEFHKNLGIEIGYVNNGVSFSPPKKIINVDSIRSELGLPKDKKIFIFIGRLSPEKKPVELVKLFLDLNHDDCYLVILGEGKEEETLRRTADLDKVKLAGFHKDITPYLLAADFYVSGSETEGLANSLLEAMSYGLPSLLASNPSHDYVVEKSKSYVGEKFLLSNPDSFKSAVEKLIKLKPDTVRDGIIREFLENYTAEAMSKNYQKLYRGL